MHHRLQWQKEQKILNLKKNYNKQLHRYAERSDGSACIKFIILLQEKWIHIITPPCISPELKTILVKLKKAKKIKVQG